MDSLTRLFQKIPANTVISAAPPQLPSPQVQPRYINEPIPNTLNLGWHWSKGEQFQMLKIANKDRAIHLYIIGASGSGKTMLVVFLTQQDIQQGNGFGVIDPHGDLVEDIKGFLACHYWQTGDESLFDRVVIVDPIDPTYTVAFNVLEILPGVSATEQAQELITVFRRLWGGSWGPRMEDLMRNSLVALAEAALTLAELPRFLNESAFRKGVLEKVSHPIATEYFQRFNGLTDRARLTWIEPVMNKINAFLSDDRIRQMLSHPKSSFDLRDIMGVFAYPPEKVHSRNYEF